ncbi:MAG: DUF4928 family protein [Syntrophorhabdales bacterium]|jgi:hypothetical protein
MDLKKIHMELEAFAKKSRINGKGPLSVVLVITRAASKRIPPYSAKDFLSPRKGQVAGLGRAPVQAILAKHGIARVLAEEGGRTSRGSMDRMKAYLQLLNGLAKKNLLDFEEIESWWVDRARDFFAAQPFRIKIDSSKSIRSIVSELIDAAFARQKECSGVMVAGAVMEHLVGAKLELALPGKKIEHKGFAVADASAGGKGDFLVGNTAIHVTTAPTEALIRKCRDNLAENLKPVIITTQTGAGGAFALAKDVDIGNRIDVLEIEQFVATNVYEWSEFDDVRRPVKVGQLVDAYNRIIEGCETDHSLKIALGS